VHHGLVCPLRKQRRHWVVPAVQNKKNGRRIRLSKVKELSFLLDLELHVQKKASCLACITIAESRTKFPLKEERDTNLNFCCQPLGHRALLLVSNEWLLFQRQQQAHQAIDSSGEAGRVPTRPGVSVQWHRIWVHVDREAIRVDGVVVCVVFLKQQMTDWVEL
jgi:hypothetical protein